METKMEPFDVAELVQTMGVLIRRMRTEAHTDGLSMSESMVLGRLSREGAATTAELARAEGVKPQSMGATVATLEEQGLVERTPHPTDGRQMIVRLTENGQTMREAMRTAKLVWLSQAIGQLEESDQLILREATGLFRRLVEERGARS
ncbi:MarR family winged helix-turn-helix transcriptional regulator [Telmatobacter bradus]|uniref:MarR family winged helix-turn-helix transcriptional regulator n=1 Tax=Telmatobacter bradus TaxID=474953 RepID=UPI003B438A5A